MPVANCIRPLGSCERFFRLYSLAFPVHFCLVAQIGGAFDSIKLAAALEQVRRRHPALRVCILDDAETGPAFYRTDNPIEVHSAPLEADTHWRGVVESELTLPFDTVPGPLTRATPLSSSHADIIRVQCHGALSRLAAMDPGPGAVFMGPGIVETPAARQQPLWRDARDVVDRLRAARSPAPVAGMLHWIAAALPPTAGKDEVGEVFASLPQSSACSSNLRVLPHAADS